MAYWVKNNKGSTGTWVGQQLDDQEWYSIQDYERLAWASSDLVLADIGSNNLIVASTNDGLTNLGINAGIDYLKGNRNEVEIVEEFTPSNAPRTGGRYQARSWELVIDHAVGTWKSLTVSYPYPISIFSTEWINDSFYDGDIVKVEIAPDTIVGVVTVAATASATEIEVSQTVVDNIRLGYHVSLDDGTNKDDLGRVVGVDKTGLKITVETATVNSFAANAYVKMTVSFIPHMCLKGSSRVELAKDVVGGSYIGANTPIVVSYQNNEGTQAGKAFSFILEYKY